MTNQFSHGTELLYRGLSGLVSGKQGIKYRLIGAFQYNLNGIRKDELPEELWERYQIIMDKVTSIENPTQGSIHASISAMTEDEASKIADELFSIFFELMAHHSSSLEC